jgi:hypothetical protein
MEDLAAVRDGLGMKARGDWLCAFFFAGRDFFHILNSRHNLF